MHPYIHCSIIYNSQAMEAIQELTNRRVDKKAVLHIHNGILLDHQKKKKRNLTFVTEWMGLKGIMRSKINQRKTSTI